MEAPLAPPGLRFYFFTLSGELVGRLGELVFVPPPPPQIIRLERLSLRRLLFRGGSQVFYNRGSSEVFSASCIAGLKTFLARGIMA